MAWWNYRHVAIETQWRHVESKEEILRNIKEDKLKVNLRGKGLRMGNAGPVWDSHKMNSWVISYIKNADCVSRKNIQEQNLHVLGLISSLTDFNTKRSSCFVTKTKTHSKSVLPCVSGIFVCFEKFWQAWCAGVAMPLTSHYLHPFHLLRIFDMPLNAAPFSFGYNWTVIDDTIIMNSRRGGGCAWQVLVEGILHGSPPPPPPGACQGTSQ